TRSATASPSGERTRSGARNVVSIRTPASSARRISRAPSTIVRPVASRSRRSRNRTAALIRGFVRLVIAGWLMGPASSEDHGGCNACGKDGAAAGGQDERLGDDPPGAGEPVRERVGDVVGIQAGRVG